MSNSVARGFDTGSNAINRLSDHRFIFVFHGHSLICNHFQVISSFSIAVDVEMLISAARQRSRLKMR